MVGTTKKEISIWKKKKYLKENAPWQVVQLRDDLQEAVFAGKMVRIRFEAEKPLDRMNYDHLAVS